jgi:hypothetical protein
MKQIMDDYNAHESDMVQALNPQPRAYTSEFKHFLRPLFANQKFSTKSKNKFAGTMAKAVNLRTTLPRPHFLDQRFQAIFEECVAEVNRVQGLIADGTYQPSKPRDMRGFRSLTFVPLHGTGSHRYMGINTMVLTDFLRHSGVPVTAVLGDDFEGPQYWTTLAKELVTSTPKHLVFMN